MEIRKTITQAGFSLIELIIVLAVIAILALIAIPSNVGAISSKRIHESLALLNNFKPAVVQYYMATGEFPENNETLSMPEPDKIIGNYVSSVQLTNGVFNIVLGNKIQTNLVGRTVSVMPVYVENSPASPVSWVCGYDAIPEGMTQGGENLTNVESQYLPLICR